MACSASSVQLAWCSSCCFRQGSKPLGSTPRNFSPGDKYRLNLVPQSKPRLRDELAALASRRIHFVFVDARSVSSEGDRARGTFVGHARATARAGVCAGPPPAP